MHTARIVYWYHPLVWYALKEMRGDREIACDTAVLQMLTEDSYEAYGNALINFAEKVSLTPFPFAAGLDGNVRQIKRRILNIASYKKPTLKTKCKGMAAFAVTSALLLLLSPPLSFAAAEEDRYPWDIASKTITLTDLSSYLEGYEGSFVLYDLKNDSWTIHDMEHAAMRVSPDSTYKIYDALFALEEGIIKPENSFIAWNHKVYPFDAWNTDQTLDSAMQASVNWYFQTMDAQLGAERVSTYIQKIRYGNQDMSSGLSSYWLEASLQISPIEQVQLLADFYNNRFGFAPENISAVKNALYLSSAETVTLFGKTGTGNIDGQDVNGWFIGYAQTADNTYFFASNINADKNATGSRAAEITMSILSDSGICIKYPIIRTITAEQE